ncbi:hypothetical protein D3C76_939900 [compost metagenome]
MDFNLIANERFRIRNGYGQFTRSRYLNRLHVAFIKQQPIPIAALSIKMLHIRENRGFRDLGQTGYLIGELYPILIIPRRPDRTVFARYDQSVRGMVRSIRRKFDMYGILSDGKRNEIAVIIEFVSLVQHDFPALI